MYSVFFCFVCCRQRARLSIFNEQSFYFSCISCNTNLKQNKNYTKSTNQIVHVYCCACGWLNLLRSGMRFCSWGFARIGEKSAASKREKYSAHLCSGFTDSQLNDLEFHTYTFEALFNFNKSIMLKCLQALTIWWKVFCVNVPSFLWWFSYTCALLNWWIFALLAAVKYANGQTHVHIIVYIILIFRTYHSQWSFLKNIVLM